MVWLYVLMALAIADDDVPVRCDAVWLSPTKTCPLGRTVAATGTGKNQQMAERAAQGRLELLVREASELQEFQYPSRPIDGESCANDVMNHGRISCAEASELADAKTCYVSFEADQCIAVDPFQLKGPAWKMMEKGRDKMCSAVATAHQTSAPIIQKKCMSLCLEETIVRCP